MKKLIYILIAVTIMGYGFTSCSNSESQEPTVEKKDSIATQAPEPVAKEVHALIHTDLGDMEIKLYNETPKHRDNFIKLAKSGYYDGTLFHRVINGFMIQGGDPDSRNAEPGVMLGNGGPDYTIPAEFMPEKHFHKKGVLAAAREPDQVNPQRASSGSQFYIVQGQVYSDSILNVFHEKYHVNFTEEQYKAYSTVGGTPHLDGGYTVYGEVVSGLDVIDKIAAVMTDNNDRPIKDIKMSIKIIEE